MLDVLMGGFVWYWFPGFLFTGLNTFAWVTWYIFDLFLKATANIPRIKPESVIVNQLFGGFSGYSFGAPFTSKLCSLPIGNMLN